MEVETMPGLPVSILNQLSTRLLAGFVALVLAALLALPTSAPALAHAQLLVSSPHTNAVLPEAPDRLDLMFNEPVTPLVIKLLAPDGAATDLTAAAATIGTTVTVLLPSILDDGTHVLSWRVVSTDAHPIAGSVVFSIGAVSADVATTPTSSRATTILLWISKLLLFSALFVGVGGAVFGLFAPLPPPARHLAAAVGLGGLILAPLSLGLHGVDALGHNPDAMLLATPWAAGFATSYGVTVLLLAAALAFAIVALVYPRVTWFGWPAWFIAAVSLSVSGHAGAAAPQVLTRTAVTLHVAGILFWVGALLPLWFLMRDRSAEADTALRRFSRIVPFAVGAILVSGIILATIQMGAPGPAWLTPYGYILFAKLGLLAVLFLLALWNRYRLTGPVLLGELTPRLHLRRSILVELVLVFIIFGLTSAWRFAPSPRAIAEADATQAALDVPVYAHTMTADLMVDITASPGRAGPVDFEFWLADAAGEPVEPETVAVSFSAPSLGIEPIRAEAAYVDGFWRLDGQAMPQPGQWDVSLDIRLSRYSLVTLSTQIELAK
jgi:copper transport protein